MLEVMAATSLPQVPCGADVGGLSGLMTTRPGRASTASSSVRGTQARSVGEAMTASTSVMVPAVSRVEKPR